MKKHTTNSGKTETVGTSRPAAISDRLKSSEKEGYPYPDKKDKQYKDQVEYIDSGSNTSKQRD